MRIIYFCVIICCCFLTGCNTQSLTDTVASIHHAAEKASVATTEEVHNIRAIELSYNNETFTVNDLFKGILRDVFWDYENKEDVSFLHVKGTWKPDLFSSYGLTISRYPELDVTGTISITLTVMNGEIIADETKVQVAYGKEQLLNEAGASITQAMYEEYTK